MIASREEIAPAAVAAHYDDLDFFYRDVWGEHVHHGLWRRGDESRSEAVRALVQLVAQEAQVESGSRVCDIGCGYGATSRMLAQEYGADVTAITLSAAQHAFATERADELQASAKRAPKTLLGDWLQNELPRESFDAAIAIESSEHMPDKAAFFAQAHRVLRPGARLVICAWLSADAPSARAERWLLEPICREGRMPHLGTVGDYDALAAAAGFQRVRYEDITRQVERTWPKIVGLVLTKLFHRPRYVRFLCSQATRNRIFALTILRIWLAYRFGAMRYGVFTFHR